MGRRPRNEETTLAATARLLRQHTAATHLRVESGLALLDPLLTTTRLRAVLTGLYDVWAAAEPVVARWADREPVLALELRVTRRRRTPLLAADLRLLDGTAEAATGCHPLAGDDTAAVLGWLYVAEGSTLGGAVLRRRMRLDGRSEPVAALRTFHPYFEGPGPMWRSYVEVLERWTDADETGRRAEAVVSAAVHSFAVLERRVVPSGADQSVADAVGPALGVSA